MKTVQFPHANSLLAAPKDWNEKLHGVWKPIPAFRVNQNTVIAFQPSEQDLDRLKEGEPIFFQFAGICPVVICYCLDKNKKPII